MIELTLEDFLMWVVGAPLVGVGLYTLLAGLRRKYKARKAKNNVISCRVCGHLYQDSSSEKCPACPDCGRINDRGRSRRLG